MQKGGFGGVFGCFSAEFSEKPQINQGLTILAILAKSLIYLRFLF
ncbi:hypothetical protein RCS94_05220 [Orbaceae bacterium ac157xtp]